VFNVLNNLFICFIAVNSHESEEQEQQQPMECSLSTPSQEVTPPATNENFFKFSSFHGGQVAVSHNSRSAVRINPLCEFNDAIVMSHRPLRDDELFEVIVEKLVSRWSGSMEAGE